MHSLGYLRQRAELALKFRDLIGLAAYSKTPSAAYTAATELGWRQNQAASCRFLAVILRDYGEKTFRGAVGNRAADRYSGELCLCECHLNSCDLEMFLGSRSLDCDCTCCRHGECFHAAHTFCRRANDCPVCYDDAEPYDTAEYNYDGGEEDDIDCSECVCSDCDGSNWGGCCDYSPCRNCGGGDCENCNCYSCCGGNDEGEDDEDEELEEAGKPEEQSPAPAVTVRTVRDVTERIQKVTGTNFPLEVHDVPGINGWADGEKIHITKAAESLAEHEKASLIAHEAAHNELNHGQKREQRAEEAAKKIKVAINESKGFVRTILTGIIVGAGEVIKARDADRNEEYEADARAKEIVKEAGYDKPADLLKKIDPMQQGGGAIISTHPPTRERIRRLEKK